MCGGFYDVVYLCEFGERECARFKVEVVVEKPA
jgi:hypothetical protein